MIKVFITDCAFINREMIKKEFEVVDNYYNADIILSGSFPNHYIPQITIPGNPLLKKLIYMTSEPAICMPRTFFYDNFDKMFMVACYNPTKPNEISVTKDNSHGAEFPYPIVPCACKAVERTDTTMKNRGIFLAGELSLDSDEKPHGFINIKRLRRQFANYLEGNPNNYVAGSGTKRGKTCLPDGSNVRVDKQTKILESNCDFVMAMENSMYPDYVTEKIGEGFTSDRVTLYLGATNIEKHVPTNCFIDLRRWFNQETKIFDFNAFQIYLNTLTQQEYDEILNNAREFRKNSSAKYEENYVDLTERTIAYIKTHVN